MKKNVMLSLVAMTSASMGAYADADLTNNIITAVGELEAGDGLTIENGVLVSTGAPVELTIGTYVPGTYKLTATTNTNAKLTLKGIELAEDGTFKLEAETELTLVAESADGKRGFTVGGFGLSHVYDYKNAAVQLRQMLSEVTAKLAVCYETDEDVVALKERASGIADKIKVLEGTDSDALYKAYKDYELYNGAANSTISGEINVLKGDVQAQVDKTTATDNAKGVITDLKTQLAEVKSALDVATEYSKGKWTNEYTAIETLIAETETAINKAYEDGSATTDYSAEKVTALKNEIGGKITALGDNIAASDADDNAYNEITPKLTAARTAYAEAVNSLRTTLPGDPDVYEDLYKKALDELAVALNNLVEAGNDNGTAESHDGASETKSKNNTLITDANKIITDTKAKYEALAKTLKAAYSSADGDANKFEEDLASLKGDLEEAGLLSKYQSDVTAVQGKVDAFRDKIETANKDHSIADLVENNVEGYNYNNERFAVQQAIDELTNKTNADLANYRAWKAMTDEISGLNKLFTETKDAVNALVSEDGEYTVNGKYTSVESTISNAIGTYRTKADAAKKNNTAVAEQKRQANTKSKIEGQITDYSTKANDAVTHYNDFAEALAAVKEAKAALVEATKNTAVTTPDGITYAAEIAAIEKFISDQETAIATAMGKKNDTHYNAVMALSVTDAENMTAKAETLTASYADNEKNYNDNNLEKSAELLSNEAQTQIANTQTRLDELNNDLDALTGYPTHSDLESRLEDLKTEVDNIAANCPKYGESTDYTALMASLYQVIDQLDDLNGDINDLEKAIDTANDIVKNNGANKTTAEGILAEINRISGEARNSYPQSSFTDIDPVTPSETDEGFLPRYRQLLADIRTIEGNITTAHGGYALVGEDWNEIKATLDGYLAEANALLDLAKAERANYDAYTEISDYYTEAGFTSLINAAITELKAVSSGAGYNYYRNLLDGADNENSYKAQVAAVEAAIKASYEGYTAVADEDGQTTTIDNLVDAIKKLAVDAKDNEEAHNAQVERGQEVLDKWAEVYSEISATDESSKKQEYLDQLMGIQKELLDLNEKVKSDWSKGESDGNGAMDAYDEIYQLIVEVANTQKDGYDEVVAADNKARYEAFLAEASLTQGIYVDAISTISDLMRTVNPEYAAKVQNIITANKSIYDYSTKIRTLKNTAEKTYEAVLGGELWDENEENKATANNYGKKITTKLNTLIGQIYDAAKDILGEELPAAQQKYDDAISALNEQGYSDAVVSGAFADVKKLIDKISADATGNYEAQKDYALAADGWLTELAKVDKMIADGQQAAANEEWNALITATNEQITKERNALSDYVTAGNLEASVLVDYDNLVENTVRAAEANAEASTDLYADLPGIKELLDEFNSKNPYAGLANDAKNDVANKAAYEALMEAIDQLQTSLDDLDAYANRYYVYYDCVSTINNLRTRINSVSTRADNSFEAGTAVADKTAIMKEVNSIKSAISTAKNMIDYTEGAALKAEIYELRNLNAEVYGEDADKFGEIEAEIDVLEKGVSDAYLLSKGKQEAYIAMEAKIAELQTRLETAKNENAVSEALTALGNALSAVEGTYVETTTTLEGCHDAVKAEYTEALGEIGTEIDEIKAAIAECGSDNSLLFYNDKIRTSIDVLSGKLNDLASKISEMEAPYVANDAAYERLNGEIEALRNAFNAVTTTIAGYRDEVKNSDLVTNYVENINRLLDEAQASVDADHEAVKLTESSTVPGGSDIADNTGKLAKNAAYYQAYFDISDLSTAVEAVKATIDESTYSTETLGELTAAYDDIVDAISEADRYRLGAYHSNVDFVGEAVPAIKEKVAEITAAIEALKTKAETMSYVLGDADGDGSVQVNDYLKILNVVLGNATIEEGSVEFFAADCNGDGKISIGDLTGVSRILRGVNVTTVRSAARRMPVAVNDAISLVSMGEGTQQRIAINLSAARTYVGCQMDIKLPAGITLTGESLGNSAAGLTLSSNDLDNGIHRVVLSSLGDDSFTNGNDAIIYLDVDVAYSYSGEGIEVTNIMFADENARVYNFADLVGGEATGISTVTMGEAVKSKIYSVGGKLMDGLKRGVNIIRNNDGSTKKVIVK